MQQGWGLPGLVLQLSYCDVTYRNLKVSLRLIFCVLDARKDVESCSNA